MNSFRPDQADAAEAAERWPAASSQEEDEYETMAEARVDEGAQVARTQAPPPSSTEVLAALLVALAVAGTTLLNALGARMLADQPPPDPGADMQLLVQAKIEVGSAELLPASQRPPAADALSRLETLAVTDLQHVALTPVVAELFGTDAGVARVDRLLAGDLDVEARADAERMRSILAPEDSTAPPQDAPSSTDTDEARDRFRARYGWFADLALDRDHEPADRGSLRAARTVALGALGAGVALLALLAAGTGLAFWAAQRLARGLLESSYRVGQARSQEPRVAYLETVFLFLLAVTVLGVLSATVSDVTGHRWPLLLHWLILAVFAWPVVRGHDLADLRRALGWQRGAGLWREIGAGLAAYVAAMPLLALGLVGSLWASTLVDQEPYHPIVDWVGEGGVGGLVVVFVLAVLWAPVVEESLFRGAFYHYLRGRLGILGACGVVSLVFAAIHPQGVAGLPFLFTLAAALALTREWRGSIIASITLHMVHNGLATLLLVAMTA